jgi:V8-like Glu-specific endopeptidase
VTEDVLPGAAIVRVCDVDGRGVGAGFLAAPGLVVTAAHVVAAARADGMVQLEFPLLTRPEGEEAPAVTAEVLSLRPIQSDDSGDTAVLAVRTPLPSGATPATLAATDGEWDESVRIFGFPDPYQHGIWVSGSLKARQGAGWTQMESQAGHPGIAPGFSGSPVWSSRLNAVVGMTVATHNERDATTAYLVPVTTLMAAHPELAGRSTRLPYRGLEPFLQEHADIFHGRAHAIDQLADAVSSRPVVVVSGPSGSGKSSLVLAGLLPRLTAGGTTVVRFRPDPALRPETMLATVLVPLLEPALSEVDLLVEKEKLAASLSQDVLALLARRLVEKYPNGLVVFADQFEEMAAGDPAAARTLLGLIIALVSTTPLRAVLTLRSASLDELLTETTVNTLGHGTMLLAPMSRDELYAAVTGPVTTAAFEPGLVDRVLHDATDAPGRLPLVEFTLTQLWDRAKGGLLTHAEYDELGGVSGALVSYAEQVYRDKLTPDEQAGARRLLAQLARLEHDGGFSRRSARVADLDPALRPVLDRLAAYRLVVLDQAVDGAEIVDIVHQVLIQQWERLHSWLLDDREFHLWQEQLRQIRQRWEDLGHDDGSLLRGNALARSQHWVTRRAGDISEPERKFVRDSGFRQRRELRVWRTITAVIAVLLIVAGTLGVVAWRTNLTNERQLHTQASHLLGRASTENLDPVQALQLALAAWHNDNGTSEAYGALFRQYLAMGSLTRLDHNLFGNTSAALVSTPDGKVVVAEDQAPDGRQRLTVWIGLLDGRPVSRAVREFPLPITAFAVSPDGNALAAADGAGGVRLWNTANNELVVLRERTDTHGSLISDLKFSPNGQRLLFWIHYGDGSFNRASLSLWDLPSRQVILQDTRDVPYSFDLALGPDGDTLVSVAPPESNLPPASGQVTNILTGAKIRDTPTASVIAENGATVVACHKDVGIQVIDSETGAEKRVIPVPDCGVRMVLDLTGRYLMDLNLGEAGGYQLVTLFDLADGQRYQLRVPIAGSTRVGTRILAGKGPNGTLTLLQPVGTSMLTLRANPVPNFTDTIDVYSPDGRYGVAVRPTAATFVDAVARIALAPLAGDNSKITFTADSRHLVIAQGAGVAVYAVPGLVREQTIAIPKADQCPRGPLSPLSARGNEVTVVCGPLLYRWEATSGAALAEPLRISDEPLKVFTRPGHPDEVLVLDGETLDVWNVTDRQAVAPIDLGAVVPIGSANGVLVDTTGSRIAAYTTDDRLSVWDIESRVRSYDSIALPPNSAQGVVGFGPNDTILLENGTGVHVWDLRQRIELATASVPSSTKLWVAGNTFVVDGQGGRTMVPLDPATWFADLCQGANRPFTPDELPLVPAGALTGPPCS